MTWQHLAARIDANVAAAPSAHARLGLAREIVVLDEDDLEGAAIFRDRVNCNFLGAQILLAGRHQRAPVLRAPRIELGVRQFETLRSELEGKANQLGNLRDVEPMD